MLSRLSVFLLISFIAFASPSIAGDGAWTGLTQCYIGGRWVTVRGNCPAPSGGGGGASQSGAGAGLYGAAYSLGFAFGQWLFGGSGPDPREEAQKQQMMAELARRQAEAERLHKEEEARRLAETYNRLASTLKLSGIPDLRLKGIAGGASGLRLKTGDGGGIAGLPGIYLDGGDKAYGIPGLPGIYTGGPGQGSGLSASGMKLKTDDADAASAQLAQPAAFDPAQMTPQQLADIAEMFGKLPPEEQARLMAIAQRGAPPGPTAAGGSSPPQAGLGAHGPGVTPPGLSGQPLPAGAPVQLQQQAAASQAAATAPTPEAASDMARAGFDRPLGAPSAAQLHATGPGSTSVPTNPAWPAHTASKPETPPTPPKLRPGAAGATAPASPERRPADPPALASAPQPADSGIDADAVAQAAMAKPASGPKEAGPSPAPRLALKLSSGSPGKPPDTAPQGPRWRKAVDCAMDEIYVRLESLVPDGGRIAGELRRDVERAIREAGAAPKHAGDVTVVPIVLDRQVAAGDGTTRQLLVQGGVHRYANGNVDVDVRSSISGVGRDPESTQTVLALDNGGRVVKGEHSRAVGRCLAR